MANLYNEKFKIENISIRHQFDDQIGEFYFSIVDVINNLSLSKEPRNYWKVLKSRLKNTRSELVTECNQLKMKASDGKYYLTDVTRAGPMLQIIQIVAPSKVATFEEFFNQIERRKANNYTEDEDRENDEKKLSTEFFDDGEISVDLYQKEGCLFVNALLAGVDPQNIFISLNSKILTIKVSRLIQNDIGEENYDYQELSWGKFSRIISLPLEVDIDRTETNFSHGLLSLQFFIQDKTRTKSNAYV